MLISLCQFILEGMLLTTGKGEYKMASFVDEQRMCRLYEKFILEYFSKHYRDLDVRASQIPWALDDGVGTMLPIMQSDITLSFGNKVLIIDADMRKPRLHRIFGIRNECGLSDVLLNAPAGQAIVGVNGLNLDFLPAGTLPPNPSELLASAAFSDLIAQLEKIYDYIIVDTPPLLVVSDALMLSEVAAGILLSCRYRKTPFKDLNKALSALKFAKFNVLGAVIVGSKNSYSAVKMRYRYGNA